MIRLMTREFAKWAAKHGVSTSDLAATLDEIKAGSFEADLGGHVIKKRIRFRGQGKSGSGRTILCFKRDDRAIFVHGYAKNEKANVSKKELVVFVVSLKSCSAFHRIKSPIPSALELLSR